MPDVALATTTPSQPAPTKQTRQHTPKVTGTVAVAIHAMVWDGLPRKAAAAQAGISEHGLYKAFRKQVVKAHYLSELEVLRNSERAQNIHRLVAIRDAADNMPAVNAIKMLEQLSDVEHERAGSVQRAPGVTVIVVQQGSAQAPMRDISVGYANPRALDETADGPKR